MLLYTITTSYLKNGTWKEFKYKTSNSMDGIKIQTLPSSSFYLQYRTCNKGNTSFYSFVKSNENDYAGLSGKPIQQLQIQAYTNSGTKLTSRIVVMYRASVDGRWLPWVSNADPEWMQSVHTKYHLDGTIDTSSWYAGNKGQDIDGLEIRVYDEDSVIDGDFTGGESSLDLSYMVDNLDNWESFSNATLASKVDGIKIQTSTSKNYYLEYKTKNEGMSDYLPLVKSTGRASNDYAGLPGKPIQLLHIQAYDKDGNRLRSGVIVMYRVHVEERWLPWVSNADPEWMRQAKTKYGLDGLLDTESTYAGNDGQNINGVEIRVFEDDASNPGADDFTGSEIKLNTQYMANSLDNWTSFDGQISSKRIDGIKIQTSPSDSFYLTYKSWNAGNSSYYPEVKSTENDYNDYAGYPGQQMQLLSIQAYDNDGNRLRSDVVVMYRVSVEGRWLPWVSNADPEWMRSVQRQYNLDGTLDTVSTYAGNAGQNINGVEIRVFKGSTNDHPLGELPGAEASVSLSYMRDNLDNWTSFTHRVTTSPIEGIKIQTSTSKGYYLMYKTKNAGLSSYLPLVKSTGTAYNDYAGLPGKAIQLLHIQAYKNDGTRLRSGVVVMYRVRVSGRWLPWVSNADPEWMVSVQSKYNLGGTLDTKSTYAGNAGQNIDGVEIRVFEENDTNGTTHTPTGDYKIINVPFISQYPKYPTGCESVSTVMALNYAGINMTVDKFIDNYLNKGSTSGFNPYIEFGGDPRSTRGWGCFAEAIQLALNKFLPDTNYKSYVLRDYSVAQLCADYINKNIPVVFFATQKMEAVSKTTTWYADGKKSLGSLDSIVYC
ncbi:C39 family peptidase [Massiliimalia timonensis]|uniref:C39 family peptidase n=1 Tax=Massiliimalia timonensis TaxID=1987501 RepID=UPI000B8B6B2B|nr:C39 family peptidase [Massiliimalia timonensis]